MFKNDDKITFFVYIKTDTWAIFFVKLLYESVVSFLKSSFSIL